MTRAVPPLSTASASKKSRVPCRFAAGRALSCFPGLGGFSRSRMEDSRVR
jgi:hypothetical protein